jgi:hypothetical protein
VLDTPLNFRISPENVSLTRRGEWLETRVLNPADKLLSALRIENRSMFSAWPSDLAVPDLAPISSAIENLQRFAIELRQDLLQQQQDDAGHNDEIRSDIVDNLIYQLREHFPEIKLSRGVYEPALGVVGAIPEYVRRAFREITDSDESLDRVIQQVLPSFGWTP